MQAVEPRITKDAQAVLAVERSIASRTSVGGTAPANVRREARKWLKRLKEEL
jgi:argininosuccinate lyase